MSKRELDIDLEYQKAFGQHIRKLRNSVGWSQGDLYTYSKISVYQIGRIENGHEGPNFQTMLALGRALGKNPMQLFDFKYAFQVNKHFPKKARQKPQTAQFLKLLYDDNFFSKPKAVADVVKEYRTRFHRQLKSADASGALLNFVRKKYLRVIKSGVINQYQNLKTKIVA